MFCIPRCILHILTLQTPPAHRSIGSGLIYIDEAGNGLQKDLAAPGPVRQPQVADVWECSP